MNYIVTRNRPFFEKIGKYNYCTIEEAKAMLTPGIAVDSETTGLQARKDKMFAMQIGTGKDNFLFDLQVYSGPIKFQEFEGLTTSVSEVLPLLEGRHLVFHNGMFDLGFLMTEGFVPDVELIWDTMIASQCLYNGKYEIMHNFKDTMEREIGVKYDKSEQKNIHRVKLSTAEAIQYCFNDVDRLKELHEELFKKLKSYGGHETYHTNRKVISALVYMELCGLPCNEYKWREKMEMDKTNLAKAERIVKDYIYDNLPEYRTMQMDLFSTEKNVTCMLSSPKQMIPVFRAFGIETETDDKKAETKKGRKGESQREKDLRKKGLKDSIEESVISLSDHEFVKMWLDYKDGQHRVNNFGQNILDEIEDGRIYVKFKPMVDTCRIAARKEGSMNSLNIPSDGNLPEPHTGLTRKCFEAKPGFDMVVCDYEGQETVVLADLSRDPVMVASVVNGLDLHCAFARLAFPEIADLSDAVIKKEHKTKRNFVKAPRFAFSYGGSGFTVAKNSGMSLEKANFLEEKFKELHPGVYEFGNEELKKAMKTGYIESADCWRLYLPDYAEFKELERKIDGMSKELRTMYKLGKAEARRKIEFESRELGARELGAKDESKGLEYEIEDQEAYEVYLEWKRPMRRFYSLRGEYFRLCLNNPVQARSAHQAKRSLTHLFTYIVKRGHLWKARISNSPYDEIVMEVLQELSAEYKEVLGQIMRDCGDHYLSSGLVKIGAEANVGKDWYSAK